MHNKQTILQYEICKTMQILLIFFSQKYAIVTLVRIDRNMFIDEELDIKYSEATL